MHYIGAHIKKETGPLINTIKMMQSHGGNALQIFVSNPRSASSPNMEVYQAASNEICEYCRTNDFKLIIHSSYTINLAKEPKMGKRVLELKDCYWINCLIDELIVSEMLGAIGVVVHVGKHTTQSEANGLNHMINAVRYVVQVLDKLQMSSKLIIETPAGAGTELLKTVEEFTDFYNIFSQQEKRHLGICIDTAHIWSSGYNVSEYYNKLSKHNAKDIVAIHLNNSKKNQGSMVDAHEHILLETAKIPLQDLQIFVANLKHKPVIILETPSGDIEQEVKWVKQNV